MSGHAGDTLQYECWGCGETFTFRALADIDWSDQPCPNRCGNILSPTGPIVDVPSLIRSNEWALPRH